ncbi:DUF4267 domain-containing protein [Microbacterium sp. A82]|uniref:DUF4267 domain-containing protein n=1 Tax=Microbacterium sp. A82 TaxID=3450452 RepID=UPI003F2B2F8F
METLGLVIAALAGLAIAAIGVLYLMRPRMMATVFGLPALPHEGATPWLRIKGIRDLTTGVVVGVLILLAPSTVIGWTLLAFAIIPVGDAVTILAARGDVKAAWRIHGTTAAVMIVGAILLLSA